MAKLILSMDNLVLKEIPLNKERITLGRKAHNDIQIDNLAISGEHAVVITILNDSFLEDMGSTNGTYINGQPVKKHFLQNNDVIELGKYKLKYFNDAPPAPEQADFEKTMILRPGAALKPPEMASAAPTAPTIAVSPALTYEESTPALAQSPAPAPVAAPAAPAMGVLQVLTGSNAGKEVELVKSLTTMGKPGVQVAVIARRPLGYFITHVEGTSFPVVNGKTLDAQPCALKDHDIIELAGIKMEFFFKA
jgi:predicted component of type VI protein secretion system